MESEKYDFTTLPSAMIEIWLDHVGEVFAPTPRQYFKDHLFDDSDDYPLESKLKTIFVATTKEDLKTPTQSAQQEDSPEFKPLKPQNLLAATVRIFERKMWLQGNLIQVAAIGEVSTKERFRKQGLASKLLQIAINFMEENEIEISPLSAATVPFYESHGWKEIAGSALIEPVENLVRHSTDFDNSWEIKKIDADSFSSDPIIEEITKIHNEFCSKFNGPFFRTNSYWKKWIANEYRRNENYRCFIALSEKKEPLGLIGLKFFIEQTTMQSRISVVDFCSSEKVNSFSVFCDLVRYAIIEAPQSWSSKIDLKTTEISYPFPLFPERFDENSKNGIKKNPVLQYMYRLQKMDAQLTPFSNPERHVFWDVDYY